MHLLNFWRNSGFFGVGQSQYPVLPEGIVRFEISLAAVFAVPMLALAGDLTSEPTGLVEFQINGRTLSPALSEAQVEVHIGSQTFTTGADSSGVYSIEVGCSGQLDDLVIIKAFGTGDQEGLAMARLTESCGRLRDLAMGDSPTLTVGPVSPLSTGLYATVFWHVQDAPDLSWPPPRAALADQLGLLQTDGSDSAARAIQYLAKGLASLPEAFDDSLELLADREAARNLIVTTEGAHSNQIIAESLKTLLWSPDLYHPANEPPPLFAGWCATLDFACNYFASFEAGGSADFTIEVAGGTGEWFNRGLQDLIFNDRLEWKSDNLRAWRLQGIEGAPLASIATTRVRGNPPVEVDALMTTKWVDFRLVNASEWIQLLALTTRRELLFPDNPEIPTEVTESSFPGLLSGLTDLNELPDWDGPEIGSRWVLALPASNPTMNYELVSADLFEFVDGDTALSMIGDVSYDWQFSDGILTISDADGQHEFRHLGHRPNRHGAMLMTARPEDAAGITAHIHAKAANLSPQFEAIEVPGRYVSGVSLNRAFPYAPFLPLQYLVIELFADGTGLSAMMLDPEAPLPYWANEVNWSIDEQNGLVINQVYEGSAMVGRRWLPVSDVPGTTDLYVLETQPEVLMPGDVPEFSRYRLNYYRRMDLVD